MRWVWGEGIRLSGCGERGLGRVGVGRGDWVEWVWGEGIGSSRVGILFSHGSSMLYRLFNSLERD